MAQTKKKRRSKHRGNAAGGVEARGRTSKAARTSPTPKPARGSAAGKTTAAERRQARLSRPPTWKGALYKGGGAAVIFFALMALLFDQPLEQAAFLALFMITLYVPLSFYTDKFIYARTQKARTRR